MATIYLVCGYKGSGKSTLIRWMSSLSETSRVDWLSGGFLPSDDWFVEEKFQQQNARGESQENPEVKWHQLNELLDRKLADDVFVHLDMTNFFLQIISSQSNSEIRRFLSSADWAELDAAVRRHINKFLAEIRNHSQCEVKSILLEAEWKSCSIARKDRCMQPRKRALIQIAKSRKTPQTMREFYLTLRGMFRCYSFTWRGHNRFVWGRKYGPSIHQLMYENFARAIVKNRIELTRVKRRENLPPSVSHNSLAALGSKFVSKVTISEIGQ